MHFIWAIFQQLFPVFVCWPDCVKLFTVAQWNRYLIPLIPTLTLWEGKLIITTTKQSMLLQLCQIIINSFSGSKSAQIASPQICFPPVSLFAEHCKISPWNNSAPSLTCEGGVTAETNGPVKTARGQQIYVGIQGHGRQGTCATLLMQRRWSSLGRSASRMGLHQVECIHVRWRLVSARPWGPPASHYIKETESLPSRGHQLAVNVLWAPQSADRPPKTRIHPFTYPMWGGCSVRCCLSSIGAIRVQCFADGHFSKWQLKLGFKPPTLRLLFAHCSAKGGANCKQIPCCFEINDVSMYLL